MDWREATVSGVDGRTVGAKQRESWTRDRWEHGDMDELADCWSIDGRTNRGPNLLGDRPDQRGEQFNGCLETKMIFLTRTTTQATHLDRLY